MLGIEYAAQFQQCYASCYHKNKPINMHHVDLRIQTNFAMKFAVAPHFSGLPLRCFYTLS